jgi:hypothetical protein
MHPCGPSEHAEPLGEGCYVVDTRLYQCTTDVLPAGALSCFDVTPCTGLCTQTITVDGREIESHHCWPRWTAYQRARHPLTCSPVPVATTPSALLPPTLDVPADLMHEVQRSGRDRLVVTAELCASPTGTTVRAPLAKSSGFPALDRWLVARLGGTPVPTPVPMPAVTGECTTVTLVLGRFECEVETMSL